MNFGVPAFAGYANPAATPRRADPATLHRLAGRSMGTTWSLVFDNPRLLPTEAVRAAVERALTTVVAQMSHWEPDSLLSRFNRMPAGSTLVLPQAFATVLRCALHWAEQSAGAWDPTIAPLVAAWGFGPPAAADASPASTERARAVPPAAAIETARRNVGFGRLHWAAERRELTQPGGAELDFSGIAKGFAVDLAVDALRAVGLTDLLMEIGGELRGCGQRPGGTAWRVAIPQPDAVLGSDNHHGNNPANKTAAAPVVVALSDLSIATSGDAWHAFEHAGRRYSHTIDPRTGAPVAHALASVTVLHRDCMQADALATVLAVLGPDEGFAFAESRQLAARFVSDPQRLPAECAGCGGTGLSVRATAAFAALQT